jgi:ABC-type sugar transport system substrate-binding protein
MDQEKYEDILKQNQNLNGIISNSANYQFEKIKDLPEEVEQYAKDVQFIPGDVEEDEYDHLRKGVQNMAKYKGTSFKNDYLKSEGFIVGSTDTDNPSG